MITLAYNPTQGGTEGLQLQVKFFLTCLGLNSICLFYPACFIPITDQNWLYLIKEVFIGFQVNLNKTQLYDLCKIILN